MTGGRDQLHHLVAAAGVVVRHVTDHRARLVVMPR